MHQTKEKIHRRKKSHLTQGKSLVRKRTHMLHFRSQVSIFNTCLITLYLADIMNIITFGTLYDKYTSDTLTIKSKGHENK